MIMMILVDKAINTAAFQKFIDSDYCHNYLHTLYLFESLQ